MEILNNTSKLVVLYALTVVCSSDVLEINGTSASKLNADGLVTLGRKFNRPLITLIGMVMENYHLCTDWSEWSICGAMTINYFSTRSRTRHCALIRSQSGDSIPEEETDVCEGICPPNYNLTKNGFCMKLYSTPLNRNEAEAKCEIGGGSLIHIDTYAKYNDVKALLTAYDEKRTVHIDGRRKDATSPWQYSNGSGNDLFYWYRGHPSTIENYLCLMLSGYRDVVDKQFLWFDYPCKSMFPFVCEHLS